jgi:hypothetical protein
MKKSPNTHRHTTDGMAFHRYITNDPQLCVCVCAFLGPLVSPLLQTNTKRDESIPRICTCLYKYHSRNHFSISIFSLELHSHSLLDCECVYLGEISFWRSVCVGRRSIEFQCACCSATTTTTTSYIKPKRKRLKTFRGPLPCLFPPSSNKMRNKKRK